MRFVSLLALICTLAFSAACSDQEESPELIQISLPYFSGCEETISRLTKITEQAARHNNWVYGVEVVEFDVKPISHGELAGYLTLYMQADAKLLTEMTVEKFLLGRAKGVLHACMPNNGIKFSASDLNHYPVKLSVLNYKGAVYPKIAEDGMYFYYNDGSYEYPELK